MDWREKLKMHLAGHVPPHKPLKPRPRLTPEQIAQLGVLTEAEVERAIAEIRGAEHADG